MSFYKEIVLGLIICSIGSLNAGVVNEISAKHVQLSPLKMLLYLTRGAPDLDEKVKGEIAELLEEALGINKNQEDGFGRFLKLAVAMMNDLRGETMFSNVKYDRLYHAAAVFITYDLFDQILNEDHTANFLTIPIGKDKPKSEAQKKVPASYSQLFLRGINLPGGYLDRFYEGTKEEVEKRKEQVKGYKARITMHLQKLLSEG